LAESGEDAIAFSDGSKYAANVELAEAVAPAAPRSEPAEALRKVATPTQKTCEAVAELLGLPLSRTLKSIALMGAADSPGGSFTLALVRGDHALNEIKLSKIDGLADYRLATEDEIAAHLGASPGFLGPVGPKRPIRVIADRSAAAMADFVVGANEDGFHLAGVNFGRDLPEPERVADLRNVVEGDASPDGRGTLRTRNDNDALTRMRVRLANDGTATLRAEGPRQATTFRARWRDSGNARIDLDVIEMNGRRVEGSGTLGIRGRDFDQVDIQVRSGADGNVDLRFRTDGRFDDDGNGNGNGNGQVPPSYNGSRAVRGTIDLPGSGRVDVRRVQVKLERNGDARVRLQTERRGRDRNIDIVGTWQANRNGSAELRWSRIDNVTVSGTGLITFWNGRDLDRIRGLARSRDGRISVDVQVSQ